MSSQPLDSPIAVPTPPKRSRGRVVWIGVGSVLIVLAVLGVLRAIVSVKMDQIQAAMDAPPPPEMPVAVTVAVAQPSLFRQTSVVVGNVLAAQSIAVRTELTGIVTDVAMQPGGVVDADEVLIRLDDRTERAELKSAEANLKLATAVLERALRLMKSNANSEQEVDVAEAELTRAEAEVDRLRVMIDKKVIRAPFAARVGLFDLHVGQYLVEGTEITTLEGIDDFYHIDFEMPAHVADAIDVGETVDLRVTETSAALQAKIMAVDSRANPMSRSVRARARLDDPPPSLQPNDSVRVTVSYGPKLPSLLVPATAIRRGPTGSMAFQIVMHDGVPRAQSRSIVAGGTEGSMVRVLSGLNPGDSVVADGSFKVTDGAMVTDVDSGASDGSMESVP